MYTHVCVYACVCVCIHIYIYIYLYIHIRPAQDYSVPYGQPQGQGAFNNQADASASNSLV